MNLWLNKDFVIIKVKMKKQNRLTPEINSSSMADIAFLLLIFFLVTTSIISDKGLYIQLPQYQTEQEPVDIPQRNLFTISINANGNLLVENKTYQGSYPDLKGDISKFILNNGRDPSSSDSPEKAIVSFKTSRNTIYKDYIAVLDIIKSAYNQIYADNAGISLEEWRMLANKHNTPELEALFNKGREGFPMNISIAEPF